MPLGQHRSEAAASAADIRTAIGEFERSAANAVAAGFEGVELHAGNAHCVAARASRQALPRRKSREAKGNGRLR